jgi:signal transduction histidine kinase
MGNAALAALPLRTDRPLGALGLGFGRRQTFGASTRRFLAILAQLCAQALERAQLYQAERDARLVAEQARAVAERSRIEAERARAQAEAAVRQRDTFISVASHELRTPLTPIKAYAQVARRLLAEGRADTSRLEQALKVIEGRVAHLDGMIGQLLDLSRIQSGKFVLELRETDLMGLAEAVAVQAQTRTARHRVVVRRPHGERQPGGPSRPAGGPIPTAKTGAAAALGSHRDTGDDGPTGGGDAAAEPDAGTGMRGAGIPVTLDIVRIEQVLANLLENAIKFSPAGGEIVVDVEEPAPDVVRVAVRDQGIGIAREHLPHVFEPYSQAGSGQERASGMGLGLYVCRQLVELHGGRIEVESTPGAGTTFVVTLPRTAGETKP